MKQATILRSKYNTDEEILYVSYRSDELLFNLKWML